MSIIDAHYARLRLANRFFLHPVGLAEGCNLCLIDWYLYLCSYSEIFTAFTVPRHEYLSVGRIQRVSVLKSR